MQGGTYHFSPPGTRPGTPGGLPPSLASFAARLGRALPSARPRRTAKRIAQHRLASCLTPGVGRGTKKPAGPCRISSAKDIYYAWRWDNDAPPRGEGDRL